MLTYLLFPFVILLVFWLPGCFILNKLRLKLSSPEPFALPTVVGLLAFTLTAYILSWLHAVILLLPILLFIAYAAIRQKLWKLTIEKQHRFPLLIVLLLSVTFSLPMLVTGIGDTTAIYRTDDIIHLGYINELIHHFPPDNPGVAGVPLRGYHFFSDFIIASVHKLTGLSATFLYFHGIPIFTAFVWGLGTYSFLFLWKKQISTALWGVVLVLFGGSFAWWLALNGHPEISLRSTFGIDQPSSALLNPPYALSVAIIIGALTVAHEYLRTSKTAWLILLGLFVGLTPMFKVYAGMLLAVGFGYIALTDLLKKRFAVLWVIPLVALLVLTTYGKFAGSGAYLLWAPLWAPHKVLIDSMPWYGYEEKLYTFGKFGMWWRIIQVELYGIFLFVIGNLGTRVLGIAVLALLWLKNRKVPSRFTMALYIMMATALSIPLFFLQSIKVFEIIQMGWYYPLFAAILGAAGIAWLVHHTPTTVGKILVTLIILVATLPSTYENFYHLVYPMPHKIKTYVKTDPYFQTMAILARDPDYDATVLELPVKETPSTHVGVLSWYRVTLPYPATLGNKRSFFHSQNIDFPNVPLEKRATFIGDILTLERMSGREATFAATLANVNEALSSEDIRYIITQFPLSNLTPIIKLFASPPYYLYHLTY